MSYLTEDTKINIVVTTTNGAAGTSAITSSAVNMAGFDGCTFLVPIGPVVTGAVTSIKVQQSSDDGGSDNYSDVEGTSITIADNDDDKLKYIDVLRPGKQYLKLVVSRATQNATIGSVLALQYRARIKPVTQGTNVAGEQWYGPAEGTA